MKRTIKLSPFGRQKDVLEALLTHSIVVAMCGRGWGKSLCGQMAMVWFAMRAPGQKIIYCAHSHKLIREMYEGMMSGLPKAILHPTRPSAEQPSPWIRFANGSKISFLCLERMGKNLGLEANFMVLDECREIREDTFHSLMPFVSRLRGRTLLLSTPRHRGHWFTRMFLTGQTENDLGIVSFKCPSRDGICYQGEEGSKELDRQAATMSKAAYLREYECELANNETAVYPQEIVDACVVPGLLPLDSSAEETILAADLGGRRDPTAIIVGDGNGRLLHSEVLPLGRDMVWQTDRLRELAESYNSTVVLETNGTPSDAMVSLVAEKLGGWSRDKDGKLRLDRDKARTVRSVMVRSSTTENLHNEVAFMLEKRRLAIPDHPMFDKLRSELVAIEFKKNADGRYPDAFQYVSTEHDDTVSALMLFVEGLRQNWIGPVVGTSEIDV